MAYTNLINAISAVVKTNGNGEITGQNMQDVLKSIVNTIGANATFAGIATPATVPPSTATNANVFYIASQNGTYSNFGGIVVADEVAILSNASGAWAKISTDIAINSLLYPTTFYHLFSQLQVVTDLSTSKIKIDGTKLIFEGSRWYIMAFRNGSVVNLTGLNIDFADFRTDGFNMAYLPIPSNFFTTRQQTNVTALGGVQFCHFDNNEGVTYPNNAIVLATYGGGRLLSPLTTSYFVSNLNTITNDLQTRLAIAEPEVAKIDNLINDLFTINIEPISLTSQNSTYHKLWLAVDGVAAQTDFTMQNWAAKNELISVTPGDKIRIYNAQNGVSNLGYSAYDNDRHPIAQSQNGRINISQQDIKDGYIEMTIAANCTLLGVSVAVDANETIESKGIRAEIYKGIILKDEFKNEINSLIDAKIADLEIKSNLTAKYFQKGASPKTFAKKPCIIAAGQSNIDGRVPFSEMPLEIQQAQPIAKCQYVKNNTSATFGALNITGLWAFDLVTYYNISQVNNLDLYVVKWSQGGTSIDLQGATTAHWTADYEAVQRAGQTSLLRNLEISILNAIAANGSNFDVRAILWHQGEGDSQNAAVAARYYDNLRNMIAYIRGIVGNETLPFVFGSISHNSQQYSPVVEDAMQRVAAEDANIYLIDMSGATLLDAYHFDAESTIYFGEMAFNALIDANVISADKLTPTRPW